MLHYSTANVNHALPHLQLVLGACKKVFPTYCPRPGGGMSCHSVCPLLAPCGDGWPADFEA